MRPSLALGVDPGRSAGMALVEGSADGPVLLGCWNIWGGDAPWDARLFRALEGLPPVRSRRATAAIETPKNGGASSRLLRASTWGALMFRVGLIHARLHDLGWRVEHVSSATWPGALGCQRGKRDNPEIRIREAAERVKWLGSHAASMPAQSNRDLERKVCAAEATLIAAWQLKQIAERAA